MPRGKDTRDHEGRKVHRERFSVEAERGWTERNADWRINAAGKGVVGPIPNTEMVVPHPLEGESDSEPDYEGIMERRAERHRPDWA